MLLDGERFQLILYAKIKKKREIKRRSERERDLGK